LGERSSVVVSAGLIGGGDLEGEGRRYRVGTGWLASVSGGHRFFGGDGGPFGVGTLSMGFSRTHVEHEASGEDETLAASDLRVGVELGLTLLEHLRPFALARAFGGPVQFRRSGEERLGGDRHHYALGLGVGADATAGLELRFESALLGERAFVWSGAWLF